MVRVGKTLLTPHAWLMINVDVTSQKGTNDENAHAVIVTLVIFLKRYTCMIASPLSKFATQV